jgi:hypothetical protein
MLANEEIVKGIRMFEREKRPLILYIQNNPFLPSVSSIPFPAQIYSFAIDINSK